MNHRKTLIVLIVFFFLIWFVLPLFVPGASQTVAIVTLPFRHLGIFVHEMGHGLFTLISGGRFYWFQMELMQGGVAVTSGGLRFLTLLGGLLGPALFGALLLQASTRVRRVHFVLWIVTGFFVVGMIYMFKPLFLPVENYPLLRNWSPVMLISVVVPGIGALITYKMLRVRDDLQRFYLQVLGVLMCYSAYSDTSYIFMYEPLANGMFSDARLLASYFWTSPETVPFMIFVITATGISILNFALMGWGVWRAIKPDRSRPVESAKPLPG